MSPRLISEAAYRVGGSLAAAIAVDWAGSVPAGARTAEARRRGGEPPHDAWAVLIDRRSLSSLFLQVRSQFIRAFSVLQCLDYVKARQDGGKGRSIAVAIKEAIERYGITERWQQDRLPAVPRVVAGATPKQDPGANGSETPGSWLPDNPVRAVGATRIATYQRAGVGTRSRPCAGVRAVLIKARPQRHPVDTRVSATG
jgi:hypothetical protein